MNNQSNTPWHPLSKNSRDWINTLLLTSFMLFVLFLFLLPFSYGIVTSLKTDQQMTTVGAPWWPASAYTYEYEGEEYDVFTVPVDGTEYEWALVERGREESSFIDPNDPERGLIVWEGRWRTLEQAWTLDLHWENYIEGWDAIKFPRLLRNTVMYSVLSTIGAVSSAALVAYGFARYDFPRRDILFGLVLATIILPPMVTMIPMYAFFNRIGWVGTWLPLIVPAFFANGYNVFLLRQFFMGIPRALDEAAMIDGAGHWRIFFSIILPQSIPALVAVTLFHFFFAWNDFLGPLIYLAGKPELHPITVGLTGFNGLYQQQENLIQAVSLISAMIPLVVFFFAQRFFMQGVVMTGVDK
ncbi:MAG TPA: carbohydrate ABC transporter permease [Anaerolineae bacterium]|nr:carbohydrate ABC transporter permease [Anaerolineae bacterium]